MCYVTAWLVSPLYLPGNSQHSYNSGAILFQYEECTGLYLVKGLSEAVMKIETYWASSNLVLEAQLDIYSYLKRKWVLLPCNCTHVCLPPKISITELKSLIKLGMKKMPLEATPCFELLSHLP
jgi:hypothetical protein